MAADILEVVVSLVLLLAGGDQFVLGAARAAAALRIRPAVIGAVIGGLGASLPELIVSSIASIRHSPQIAVGNLVGSIVANVSLALTAAAFISTSPTSTCSRSPRASSTPRRCARSAGTR